MVTEANQDQAQECSKRLHLFLTQLTNRKTLQYSNLELSSD